MKCADCKVIFPDDYNFCPVCGKKLFDEMWDDIFTEKSSDRKTCISF